jgi:K+-transporting ATPase KdpF subunit
MRGSARACEAMLDLIFAGAVAALLLIYLIWALVRPEDF